MVKTMVSSITMAMVAANDTTSLLQMSAGVRQSQGQRILAAVAEEGVETICVQAAAGDVAPVSGSFTARLSQQAVVVAAGSVAGVAGSFCVAKQDVLLIQRTFGLNTARDFEAALGSKNNKATTTTTTMDWATFDFAGNLTKKVMVKMGECPSVEVGLVQTVEASVSDKQSETADKKQLDADQTRVCGCRNFLKSTAETPNFFANMEAALKGAAPAELLLQRNFDATLVSKNTAKKTTTTTTTATIELAPLAKICTGLSSATQGATEAAKELNNPAYVGLYQSVNITGGWQHCDKSWVVQGACGEDYKKPEPRTVQSAWDNHFSAFGAQNVTKILEDYSEDSVITVYNNIGGSQQVFQGLAGATECFEGLFASLFDVSDLAAPVQDVNEALGAKPGSVLLIWSAAASGYAEATDTFVFDAQAKILRQNVVVTYKDPRATGDELVPIPAKEVPTGQGPVHSGWANHFAGFGGQNVTLILKDYTEKSDITLYNQVDGSKVIYRGLEGVRKFFNDVFETLTDLSDLAAPVQHVEESPPGVFLTWSNPASGYSSGTDTFIFDRSGKIVRHHVVVHYQQPPVVSN